MPPKTGIIKIRIARQAKVLCMSLLYRLQQSFQTRLYRFMPTEQLIARVAKNSGAAIQPLLNVLKERQAFQNGRLESVDWSSSQLNRALLSSCRLANASFVRAQLQGAYLAYSDLRHANFEDANLTDAHLRAAKLAGANLTASKLQGANFARADLNRARLVAADLSQANLWQTDLRGANLTNAVMTGCHVSAVKTDSSTILPNGKANSAAVDWASFTSNQD